MPCSMFLSNAIKFKKFEFRLLVNIFAKNLVLQINFCSRLQAMNELKEMISSINATGIELLMKNLSEKVLNHPILEPYDRQTSVAIVISTFLIGFIFLITFTCWLFGKTGKKLNHILLMGPEDVGKTHLFLNFTRNSNFSLTCTSLLENVAPVTVDRKRMTVVDVPGNGRIIWPIFDKYKYLCSHLLFLIDSSTVLKESKAQSGEYLFHILTDPVITKLRPKITILCGKQDTPLAKSASIVKQILEAELTTLRKTTQASLASTENQDTGAKKRSESLVVGKNGSVELSLLPYKVEVMEFSNKSCSPAEFDPKSVLRLR